MSNSMERQAKPDPTLQTAHSREVSRVLMSFNFPRGLTDNISGLLLCAGIFQTTVQECTFGQARCNSYMTILIRNHHDDVESGLSLFALDLRIPKALLHTPWCKS